MAGRKWPAVQAGVVLRSGPGLKVDLWRNPSFNFGDAGLDWFQTQLLIVNETILSRHALWWCDEMITLERWLTKGEIYSTGGNST